MDPVMLGTISPRQARARSILDSSFRGPKNVRAAAERVLLKDRPSILTEAPVEITPEDLSPLHRLRVRAVHLLSPPTAPAADQCTAETPDSGAEHLEPLRAQPRPRSPNAVALPPLPPRPPDRGTCGVPPGRRRAARLRCGRGNALKRLTAAATQPALAQLLLRHNHRRLRAARWATLWKRLRERAQERREVARAAVGLLDALREGEPESEDCGSARAALEATVRELNHPLVPRGMGPEELYSHFDLSATLEDVFVRTVSDGSWHQAAPGLLDALITCVSLPFGATVNSRRLMEPLCAVGDVPFVLRLLSEEAIRSELSLAGVLEAVCLSGRARIPLLHCVLETCDVVDLCEQFSEPMLRVFDAAVTPQRGVPGESRESALHLVESMLRHPCVAVDVGMPGADGTTVLHGAAADGNADVIRIIGKHAPVEHTDPMEQHPAGVSPFDIALKRRSYRAALALLSLPGCPGTLTRAGRHRVAGAMAVLNRDSELWQFAYRAECYHRLNAYAVLKRRGVELSPPVPPAGPVGWLTPDQRPASPPDARLIHSPERQTREASLAMEAARLEAVAAEAARKRPVEIERRRLAREEEERQKEPPALRAVREEAVAVRALLDRLSEKQQRIRQQELDAARRRREALDEQKRQRRRRREAVRREEAARREAERETEVCPDPEDDPYSSPITVPPALMSPAARTMQGSGLLSPAVGMTSPSPLQEQRKREQPPEPDDDEMLAVIHDVVTGGEFADGMVSVREIRRVLEQRFGTSLQHRRASIKAMVSSVVYEVESGQKALEEAGDADWA